VHCIKCKKAKVIFAFYTSNGRRQWRQWWTTTAAVDDKDSDDPHHSVVYTWHTLMLIQLPALLLLLALLAWTWLSAATFDGCRR